MHRWQPEVTTDPWGSQGMPSTHRHYTCGGHQHVVNHTCRQRVIQPYSVPTMGGYINDTITQVTHISAPGVQNACLHAPSQGLLLPVHPSPQKDPSPKHKNGPTSTPAQLPLVLLEGGLVFIDSRDSSGVTSVFPQLGSGSRYHTVTTPPHSAQLT